MFLHVYVKKLMILKVNVLLYAFIYEIYIQCLLKFTVFSEHFFWMVVVAYITILINTSCKSQSSDRDIYILKTTENKFLGGLSSRK